MENKIWKDSVGSMIVAIWLYTFADIAASITAFINGILHPEETMGMFSSLVGGWDKSVIGFGVILEWLFSLLVLLGYFLFYRALSRFMRLQRSDADRMAVAKVRKGYILLFMSILVGFIPLVGKLMALIVAIVAYALMILGYKGLRDSATCTESVRNGTARLRVATIWILVGYLIGSLPLGGFAESLILLITFFVLLSGWGLVRQGAPVLSAEEADVQSRQRAPLQPSQSTVPAWWFPTYVGLSLVSAFVNVIFCAFVLFYAQSFHPQLFGELTLIAVPYLFMYVVVILHLAICLYVLFSRKVALSRIGRIGICMVMASLVCSHLFPYVIPYIYSNISPASFGAAIGSAGLFFGIMGIVGMLMFVWTTACRRITKIAMTVYEVLVPVGAYLSFALRGLLESLLWGQHGADPLHGIVSNSTFDLFCRSSFELVLNLAIFVLVLIAAVGDGGTNRTAPGSSRV